MTETKWKASDTRYVLGKVAHLKRAGLVTGKSTGIGKHGGACPDWLRKEQDADAKARGETS